MQIGDFAGIPCYAEMENCGHIVAAEVGIFNPHIIGWIEFLKETGTRKLCQMVKDPIFKISLKIFSLSHGDD